MSKENFVDDGGCSCLEESKVKVFKSCLPLSVSSSRLIAQLQFSTFKLQSERDLGGGGTMWVGDGRSSIPAGWRWRRRRAK